MLQSILSFDALVVNMIAIGILVLFALLYREMKLLQKRTNELALQLSELKILLKTI